MQSVEGGIGGQVIGLARPAGGLDADVAKLLLLAVDGDKAIAREEGLLLRRQAVQHVAIGNLAQVQRQSEILTRIGLRRPGGQSQSVTCVQGARKWLRPIDRQWS